MSTLLMKAKADETMQDANEQNKPIKSDLDRCMSPALKE
jgi:hypothetical protein